ncbi:hypothetical protein VNO80_08491 [Phaseolus coccineus]|uniref:Uncharacterized protein n=1 Tax=Phaseolus coccineus TaxID=3886 RepID=A0AAN9R8P3_PHACN
MQAGYILFSRKNVKCCSLCFNLGRKQLQLNKTLLTLLSSPELSNYNSTLYLLPLLCFSFRESGLAIRRSYY